MLINLKDADLDKSIYRIISLERLLELFVIKKNTLVRPTKWPDTFENFILKSKVRRSSGEIVQYNFFNWMYGQCWTLHNASDAMWQIYSPNKNNLRIKTTIRKLRDSLYSAQPYQPEAYCCVGKVKYLGNKGLIGVANSTFEDYGVTVGNIFNSLLIKRKAFLHENEVRALHMKKSDDQSSESVYQYEIDPHDFVTQIMIDPRRSYSEYKVIEDVIRKTTGYKGSIKRSLLYTLPKDITLDVTDTFFKEFST